MEFKKDIRFTEKKVDDGWKEQVAGSAVKAVGAQKPSPATSAAFLSLIQSLGFQALIHLGSVPNPKTHEVELNLDAARDTIDLLVALRDKTTGNLSAEEEQALTGLLAELQVKFSQTV